MADNASAFSAASSARRSPRDTLGIGVYLERKRSWYSAIAWQSVNLMFGSDRSAGGAARNGWFARALASARLQSVIRVRLGLGRASGAREGITPSLRLGPAGGALRRGPPRRVVFTRSS